MNRLAAFGCTQGSSLLVSLLKKIPHDKKIVGRFKPGSFAPSSYYSSSPEPQKDSFDFFDPSVYEHLADAQRSENTENIFNESSLSFDANIDASSDFSAPSRQMERAAETEKRKSTLNEEFDAFLAKSREVSPSIDTWMDFYHKFMRLQYFRQAAIVLIEMKQAEVEVNADLYASFLKSSLSGLLVDEIVHIYLKPMEYVNRPHRKAFIEAIKTVLKTYKELTPLVDNQIYYRMANIFYRFKSLNFYRLLLEHLENHRIPVPIEIFNMLMSLLSDNPNFFYNVKMIYVARKATGEIDERSTYWFLLSMIKARKFDELKSFMSDLHINNEAKISHYEMIVLLLLRNNFVEEAKSTFEDLKLLKGFEPTKVIYSHFLSYFGLIAKNQKEFFKFFEDFSNTFTNAEEVSGVYSLYFKAATSLAPHNVSEYLRVLMDKKVPITIELYSAVISILLSNNISYETRSFLSNLFNNWAGIDDSKSSYEVHPNFQPIISKLPISIASIFNQMHMKNIDAFTLDNVVAVSRYLYGSRYWEEILRLYDVVDKAQIFLKPAFAYHVLFASIYLKKTGLVMMFLGLICRRRLILLDKFSERLIEALEEFKPVSREHAIFKVLRTSLNQLKGNRRYSKQRFSVDTAGTKLSRGKDHHRSGDKERQESNPDTLDGYSTTSLFSGRSSTAGLSDARTSRRSASSASMDKNTYEEDRMLSSFSNDSLF